MHYLNINLLQKQLGMYTLRYNFPSIIFMSFTLIQLCNFLHIKLNKNPSFFKINLTDETEKFVFIKSKSQSTSASTDNPKNCLIMELESFNGTSQKSNSISIYFTLSLCHTSRVSFSSHSNRKGKKSMEI